MNLADRLMNALTDPDSSYDEPFPDLSQLSDEELGTLFAESYAVTSWTRPAAQAGSAIKRAAEERQPRFTPDVCRRFFEVLVERTERFDFADLTLGLSAVEHCTGPLPDLSDPVAGLIEWRLDENKYRQPYAILSLARLAGEAVLDYTVERMVQREGPIVADEIAVVAALPREEQILLAAIGRDHPFGTPAPPDAWRRSAADSAYVAFARRALEAAADRTDAIRAGEIPYRSDKAFTDREVMTIGQAARVALLRDEDWLPPLLDRLLPGVAVAPTAARATARCSCRSRTSGSP